MTDKKNRQRRKREYIVEELSRTESGKMNVVCSGLDTLRDAERQIATFSPGNYRVIAIIGHYLVKHVMKEVVSRVNPTKVNPETE